MRLVGAQQVGPEKLATTAGFTLLEILLVLAIITIILAFSFPAFSGLTSNGDARIAKTTVASSLHRAQMNSRAISHDSSWGVYVETGQLTLFAGDSYASRDEGLDQLYDLPAAVEISGDNEIIFTKVFGLLEETATITFTSQINEVTDLTVNSRGTVDF